MLSWGLPPWHTFLKAKEINEVVTAGEEHSGSGNSQRKGPEAGPVAMGAGSDGEGRRGQRGTDLAGSSAGIAWFVTWRGRGRERERRELETPRSLAQGAEEMGS